MVETLVPEGKLDLAAVNALHAEMVARSGHDIVLDLENVTLFGALCLQTCLAAARSALDTQNAFQIVNASEQVLGQIAAMGFTPETIAEGAL